MIINDKIIYDAITKKATIMRDGEYLYLAGEIGISGRDTYEPIRVHRPAEEVQKAYDRFNELNRLPVTCDHPEQFLDLTIEDNYSMGEGINPSYEKINDKNLLNCVIILKGNVLDEYNKGLRELSCGWEGEFVEAEKGSGYEYIQIFKDINHIALVNSGRCGKECKVADKKTIKDAKYEVTIAGQVKTNGESYSVSKHSRSENYKIDASDIEEAIKKAKAEFKKKHEDINEESIKVIHKDKISDKTIKDAKWEVIVTMNGINFYDEVIEADSENKARNIAQIEIMKGLKGDDKEEYLDASRNNNVNFKIKKISDSNKTLTREIKIINYVSGEGDSAIYEVEMFKAITPVTAGAEQGVWLKMAITKKQILEIKRTDGCVITGKFKDSIKDSKNNKGVKMVRDEEVTVAPANEVGVNEPKAEHLELTIENAIELLIFAGLDEETAKTKAGEYFEQAKSKEPVEKLDEDIAEAKEDLKEEEEEKKETTDKSVVDALVADALEKGKVIGRAEAVKRFTTVMPVIKSGDFKLNDLNGKTACQIKSMYIKKVMGEVIKDNDPALDKVFEIAIKSKRLDEINDTRESSSLVSEIEKINNGGL
jgi:hypothetical protein